MFGLMAGVAISSAALAQSPREIRKDQRAVQEHREDLNDAQQRGDRGDIREAREDLRGAHKELREDRRDQRTNAYVAPYRHWTHSRVAEGSRLRSGFYGSRYVIADRARYGLDSAARNQRWVRYGDDILLVNVRSGRVIQVMPNRYREM
jgi:Ni/Co efflux regulator RcnB